MKAKTYRFNNNTIYLTDEYLVFDKNKAVNYKHLLFLKAETDTRYIYCILGQYKPGCFFAHICDWEDHMTYELLNKLGYEVIHKFASEKITSFNSRFENLVFDDGIKLDWTKGGEYDFHLYFTNSNGNRVCFSDFKYFNFGEFRYKGETNLDLGDWHLNKNIKIIKFNPFDNTNHDELVKNIKDFRKKYDYYKVKYIEKFHNNYVPKAQLKGETKEINYGDYTYLIYALIFTLILIAIFF